MKPKRRKAEDTPFAGFGSLLENLLLDRGVSQVQLAEKMGMVQSALSHLERRDDILLSTLTEYVESLGGSLNIDVKFRGGETFKLLDGSRVSDAAHISDLAEDDGQMALPTILGPEQRRPSRDVLFSIRPVHAEKILKGSKTVELR